ncbi:MAG: oligopeptide:H+ symporter [Micrococcaceae bacterium]
MEQKNITQQKTFMGHPRVLANLFGVEVWERFSFYGMSAILAYYMYYPASRGGLGIAETTTMGVIGAYTGGIYFSALLGAWFADRVFGSERTLFYAAVVVMAGHITMALLPGVVGLSIGLPLIALGAGGVKANASSMVGTLYKPGDHRRDAGFSLFYLGIYIGAVTGPLLTGILQVKMGFHYGFGLAAIGMAIGLAQYTFGRKNLPESAHVIHNPLTPDEKKKFITFGVGIVAALVLLFATGIFNDKNIDLVMIGASIICTIVLFSTIMKDHEVSDIERNQVKSFIPLYFGSVIFWILYYQQTTVLTVFSDKQLNRSLFGIWEMPAAWIQSINPFFVLLLAAAFAKLWSSWGPKQPSTITKFATALFLAGISFLMFTPIASMGKNTAPLLYVIFVLFILSIAELLLSPIGLSISTKLAPKKYKTQMVALFFLSMSLGTALAGRVAKYYTEQDAINYFIVLGVVSILSGVVLVVLRKPTQKLMGSIR